MPAPKRTGTARLTLEITTSGSDESTSYIVRPDLTDDRTKLYTLKKDDGTTYITGINSGAKFCTCPDQRGNRPQGGCKHIKALKALELI